MNNKEIAFNLQSRSVFLKSENPQCSRFYVFALFSKLTRVCGFCVTKKKYCFN